MLVQLKPLKPVLKALGTMLLKLRYDEVISNFAFSFKLRLYSLGAVLADQNILKLGFGVGEDFRRLAKLHPVAFGAAKNGGPTGGVGPVLDLQNLWAAGQGLTLVHVSAQPEPFLTQNTP